MKNLLCAAILAIMPLHAIAQNCQITETGELYIGGGGNISKIICDTGFTTVVQDDDINYFRFRSGNNKIASKNNKLNKFHSSDFVENKNISKLIKKYNLMKELKTTEELDSLNLHKRPLNCDGCAVYSVDEILNDMSGPTAFKYCANENVGKPISYITTPRRKSVFFCVNDKMSDSENRQQIVSVENSLGKADVQALRYSLPSGKEIPELGYTIKHNGHYLIFTISRSPYAINLIDLTGYIKQSNSSKIDNEF